MHKVPQDAQTKLFSVVADLFGVSSRAMLDAVVAGERSPRTMADLARAGPAAKKPTVIEALTGQFDELHGRLRAGHGLPSALRRI